MPVPAVQERRTDGSVVMEFREGQQGQELIDRGHADQVLASCGALLRRLHDVDPGLLVPGDHPATNAISHGDFGPNNTLLDPASYTVTALLDWEFSEIGPRILDVAWSE